jgi:hypothetical protein
MACFSVKRIESMAEFAKILHNKKQRNARLEKGERHDEQQGREQRRDAGGRRSRGGKA